MNLSFCRSAVLLAGLVVLSVPASCGGDDNGGGSGGKSTTGGGGSGGVATGGGGSAGVATGGGAGVTSGGGGSGGGTAGVAGAATGGSAGADASDDGNTGGSDGGDCNTLVNTGGAVPLVAVAADLPAATGGTIAPGKYVLTEFTKYDGSDGGTGPTGSTLKETLLLTASTLDSVEAGGSVDGGLGPDERATYSYTAAGTTLALAPSCGTGPGQALKYSAVTSDAGATTLQLVVFGNVLATYTLQ